MSADAKHTAQAAMCQAARCDDRSRAAAARRPGRDRRDVHRLPFKEHAANPVKGRSAQGKLLIAGAVEVDNQGHSGRVRLGAVDNYTAKTLHEFVATNITPSSTGKTDGWTAYADAPDISHEPRTIGPMAAYIVLAWTHRVFSNLKSWALGVYHGLRRKHLQRYLDEFTFPFNRRRKRHAAFETLLGIATRRKPITYQMLIAPEPAG